VAGDYWCDIGSIQSYLQANWDALDGRVRCHIPGRREGEAWVGDGVEFGLGVHIDGPAFIGDEVKLKAGAWLNDHVVVDKYGIGGLINVELTPEFCARLGAAFGATLPKGSRIAVGRDHARSSRMIKRAIVSGIVSAGGKVRDVHELPAPVTQFATRDGRCDA